MNPFDLQRDAFGLWVLVMPDGTRHSPVTALRAYPVSAPDEGVALMDAEGHEIFWIDALTHLAEPLRAQVEALCLAQGVPAASLPTFNYELRRTDGVSGGNPDLEPETTTSTEFGGLFADFVRAAVGVSRLV